MRVKGGKKSLSQTSHFFAEVCLRRMFAGFSSDIFQRPWVAKKPNTAGKIPLLASIPSCQNDLCWELSCCWISLGSEEWSQSSGVCERARP